MKPAWFSQERRNLIMEAQWNRGQNATESYRSILSELVRPRMRLLHAGCGWDKNNVSRPFKDSCDVVGIDMDPRVRDHFHSAFHLGSISDMPFEENTFDLIFSEYVLEHVDDPQGAFREMFRVLRPGGRIVILTPNLLSYKSLIAASTPQCFHHWIGRIRYGPGHEADMYPTLYRCNTPKRFNVLAERNGLRVCAVQHVSNGPTWFARFPILFDAFNVFHKLISKRAALAFLRCALIVELRKCDASDR